MNSYHATIMRSIYEPHYLWLIMFRVFTVFGYLPLSLYVCFCYLSLTIFLHISLSMLLCVSFAMSCFAILNKSYGTKHTFYYFFIKKLMLWKKNAVSINAKTPVNDTPCVKVILHYVSSSLSPYLQFKENLLFLPCSIVTKKLTKPDRTLNIILVFLSESYHLAVFAQKI